MGMTNVHFILFLTFISLPGVRSENVTCRWDGSIEAEGDCFLFNDTKLSYSDAKSSCQSKSGVLAKLKSTTQFLAAAKYINYGAAWIGANDSAEEGKWVWEDDGAVATELTKLWCPPFEPSNKTLSEDCALMGSALAFDEECDSQYGFICKEKAMITTPDSAASTTVDTIFTSISTVTVPVTTMMKCGAIFINFNVQILLLLNLYAFSYLVI